MSKPVQTLVDQFVPRYLGEYDNRYAGANLPVDPIFLEEVGLVAAFILGSIGQGFFGKMGSDLYDKMKAEIFKRASQKYKKSADRVIRIEGEDRDRVPLDFGQVRPLFKISKGWTLVLKNVTLIYEGAFSNIIEEEVAPSFYPINVALRRGKLPPNVPHKIRATIFVGEGAKKDSPLQK